MLTIGRNQVEDLSPLSQCPDLEELSIYGLIMRDLVFFKNGFKKLKVLIITRSTTRTEDLSPITKLQNLEVLDCQGIPLTTSLAPLARCYKLKKLVCSRSAKELNDLNERRPDLDISRQY